MRRYGRPGSGRQREAIDLVYPITSFELFDAFSGEARRLSPVARPCCAWHAVCGEVLVELPNQNAYPTI
jgi:hypothetical protein